MRKAIVISESVIEEMIGGEVLLLSLVNEKFFSLNAAGQFIWGQLRGGGSEELIVSAMVKKFGISELQAESDLQQFLADLSTKDLINPAD